MLQRLAVLVFLHDIGKLNTGFQSKAWLFSSTGLRQAGHVAEGRDLLDASFQPPQIPLLLRLDDIFTWGDDTTIYGLFQASLSHHGTPVIDGQGSSGRDCWKPANGYDPVRAAAQLGQALSQWYPEAFQAGGEPLPSSPEFGHLFAGLVSLADWLGSDRDYFSFVPDFREDYIEVARAQAARVVQDIGLDLCQQRQTYAGPCSFQKLTEFDRPNAHQALVDAASVDEQLLILEAETGAGKTEAALLRYVRLWEAGHVDGLYFAVPTRSAAVQLHQRVHEAARRVFGAYAPETLLAVPGYMKAGDAEGQSLPGYEVLWDDDKNTAPERLALRWAAENSKRYMAAQIAVGTVDQAMLAALPVKHAHLRGAGLARSLLVIDEVHASDRYMTEIQSNLLDAHFRTGGYAMLMSATLGERARAKWRKQPLLSLSEAIELPYPALWERDGPSAAPQSASFQKQVEMVLQEIADADDFLEIAHDAATQGAKVLIIRNTVDLAVKTLGALEARGVSPDQLLRVNGVATLHHGRFAVEDRKLLDKAVEDALGKKRSDGGQIIVGTQTLEQSLDIDADILLTDLCPVDVLLQRIGRLHRHQSRKERAIQQPRCVVLIPKGGLAQCLEPKIVNGLGAFRTADVLSGIYVDLLSLEATRRLIEAHPCWDIPKMNRFLVELATHPEAHQRLLKELPEAWEEYERNIMAKDMAAAQQASYLRLDTSIPFGHEDGRFPSNEEKVRTRLGGEGITVRFPPDTLGPFGAPISQINLPEHWSKGLDPEAEPENVQNFEEGLCFSFSGLVLLYGRCGLAKGCSQG